MKAGIAVDAWKLPIFERRLKAAGHTFTNHGELMPGVLLLRVDTDNGQALAQLCLAANTEAARTGAPNQ